MKFLLAFLLAMSAVMAAPTKPASAVKIFQTEVLDAVLEDLCLDMSEALCTSKEGHTIQYGVYDPTGVDGLCACSDRPSRNIVRQLIPCESNFPNEVAAQSSLPEVDMPFHQAGIALRHFSR